MTMRRPPALAMWLLRHAGSGYRSESLQGDLFEEYQHGRAPWWYWRQVLVAICVARVRGLRAVLSRFAVPAVLRLFTEIAILLGGVVVAAQSRQVCSVQALLLSPTFIVTLVGLIALAQAVGYYLSLRRSTRSTKQPRIRHLLTAFTLATLSLGTLTWAGTTSNTLCVGEQCVCHSGGPQ
jgi:hypothetical protein